MSVLRRLRVVRPADQEVVMNQAVKVAFATTDSKTVNQHFGSAKGFVTYAIASDGASQVEISEFGVLAQDGNEDKLDEKIALLEGCEAVYCQAAGPSAVKRLLSMGVQPIKVSEGACIAGLIDDLQAEMKAGASGWLAKALEKKKPASMSRFDEMEQDGWDE